MRATHDADEIAMRSSASLGATAYILRVDLRAALEGRHHIGVADVGGGVAHLQVQIRHRSRRAARPRMSTLIRAYAWEEGEGCAGRKGGVGSFRSAHAMGVGAGAPPDNDDDDAEQPKKRSSIAERGVTSRRIHIITRRRRATRGVAGETPRARAAHHGRARRQWGGTAREARARRGGDAPAPVAVTTTASLFVGAFALLDCGAASGPAVRAARGRVLSARDRDRSWRRHGACGSILSISPGDPGRRSQGSGGRRAGAGRQFRSPAPPRGSHKGSQPPAHLARHLTGMDSGWVMQTKPPHLDLRCCAAGWNFGFAFRPPS